MIQENSGNHDDLTQDEGNSHVPEAGTRGILAPESNGLDFESNIHCNGHCDWRSKKDNSQNPHRHPLDVRAHLEDVLLFQEKSDSI